MHVGLCHVGNNENISTPVDQIVKIYTIQTHQNQGILRRAVTDHFTYIVDIRANVVPRIPMHSVGNCLFTAGL